MIAEYTTGSTGFDVDREGNEVASEGLDHLFGDRLTGSILRLAGRGTEMRGRDDAGYTDEGGLGGGFVVEHVDGSTGDLTGGDRLGKREFVDDAAAGDVNDPQMRLGEPETFLVDQPDGLAGLRHMEGEKVGCRNEVVEFKELDVEVFGRFGWDERIVGNDLHTERNGAMGDKATDTTEADNAERLVLEFDTFPLGAFPTTVDQSAVRLRNVAGLRQQERHRVLRG